MDSLGICVACLKHKGVCVQQEFEGSRRCGRDRDDLPDFLSLPAGEGEPYSLFDRERARARLYKALGLDLEDETPPAAGPV